MTCKIHPNYGGRRPPTTKHKSGCTCDLIFVMLQRSTIEREFQRGRIGADTRVQRLEALAREYPIEDRQRLAPTGPSQTVAFPTRTKRF